jgi:hypothetical protein
LFSHSIKSQNDVLQAGRVVGGSVMLVMILAVALAQAAPATAAAEPAKAEKPKKVCVEEAQMGSHFKKRICATPDEWEKRRERDAAAMSKGGSAPVKP